MADTKLSALTPRVHGVARGTLCYAVLDPDGSPSSKAITAQELVGHSTAGDLDPSFGTDCATAIGACAGAVEAEGGGKLFTAPGTYKLGSTVTAYPNVSFCGAGSGAAGSAGTIFKSSAAVPMFERLNTSFEYPHRQHFSDLTLNGNSVGTIGINLRYAAWFGIDNMVIGGFTNYQMDLQAIVTSTFERSWIQGGQVGVRCRTYDSIQCNFNVWRDCVFKFSTQWGIQIDGAANNLLDHCNLESIGTAEDNSTGVVEITNSCPSGEGPALIARSCWLEACNGAYGFYLGNPAAHDTTYVLDSCVSIAHADLKYGVQVRGEGNRNRLITCGGTKMSSAQLYDVYLTGSGAYWAKGPSYFGSEDHSLGAQTTFG